MNSREAIRAFVTVFGILTGVLAYMVLKGAMRYEPLFSELFWLWLFINALITGGVAHTILDMEEVSRK